MFRGLGETKVLISETCNKGVSSKTLELCNDTSAHIEVDMLMLKLDGILPPSLIPKTL